MTRGTPAGNLIQGSGSAEVAAGLVEDAAVAEGLLVFAEVPDEFLGVVCALAAEIAATSRIKRERFINEKISNGILDGVYQDVWMGQKLGALSAHQHGRKQRGARRKMLEQD